jgi:ion channel
VRLLQGLGYSNLSHYHEGLAGWIEAGLPVESSTPAADLPAPQDGVGVVAAPRRPRVETISRRRQWGNAALDLIERLSPARLFAGWIAIVLACGAVYWLTSFSGRPGLLDRDVPIARTLHGLLSAIYFSFVTTTSVGYGDVVPVGAARILSIAEAIVGLLVFGALVAKFVSRRQDEMVRDIYAVAFENRLDRVQTNLHMVLAEMQTIAALCEGGLTQPIRVAARLESAVLVFSGELRTIHSLLYRPEQAPPEAVLEALLASLASVLLTLGEVLKCLPPEFERSQPLQNALRNLSNLAEEICADCVPQVYAPSLRVWMDRVQENARAIA